MEVLLRGGAGVSLSLLSVLVLLSAGVGTREATKLSVVGETAK